MALVGEVDSTDVEMLLPMCSGDEDDVMEVRNELSYADDPVAVGIEVASAEVFFSARWTGFGSRIVPVVSTSGLPDKKVSVPVQAS